MRLAILTVPGVLLLIGGAAAQNSGDTPCDPAIVPIMGPGAWDYDTSINTTMSGIDDAGNSCGSNTPPPGSSPDSLHFDRWFLWSPLVSGNYVIDTCSPTTTGGTGILNYDTKVSIFDSSGNCADIVTGTPLFIVCGEDGNPGMCLSHSTQVILIGAVAGQEYWFQCGGWAIVDVGPAVLTIDVASPPPPNDACGAPTVIAGVGVFPFDNNSAITDGLEDPLCVSGSGTGNQINSDVWYRWTAPSTGIYRAETCSLTTLDTKLGVYLDQPCPPMNPINCSDDNCPNAALQSSFDFNAVIGNDYLFRLGSWSPITQGSGDFMISLVSSPAQIGTSYCTTLPNSTGGTASIEATGSESVGVQQLALESSGLPPNVNGIHYYGTGQILLPFGDGFRCVSGAAQRLPFNSASPGGVMLEVDVWALPTPNVPITAGSTLHFQGWYRDPLGPIGSGFNLTDGVMVTFTP